MAQSVSADRELFFNFSIANPKEYPAEVFVDYVGQGIVTTGVVAENNNQNEVVDASVGGVLKVQVESGGCFVEGYFGSILDSTILELDINIVGSGNERIDSIVCEVNRESTVREINYKVIEGTVDSLGSAVPPTLDQDIVGGNVYQFLLANVTVINGLVDLSAAISDERTFSQLRIDVELAKDSEKLNGASDDVDSIPDTILKRDSAGNIQALSKVIFKESPSAGELAIFMAQDGSLSIIVDGVPNTGKVEKAKDSDTLDGIPGYEYALDMDVISVRGDMPATGGPYQLSVIRALEQGYYRVSAAQATFLELPNLYQVEGLCLIGTGDITGDSILSFIPKTGDFKHNTVIITVDSTDLDTQTITNGGAREWSPSESTLFKKNTYNASATTNEKEREYPNWVGLEDFENKVIQPKLNLKIDETVADGKYEPKFSKNTGFNKNFGTSAGTVLEGDAAPGDIGAEPAFSKNTGFNKNFGTSAGTVLEGDASPGDIGAEPAFTKNTAFNKNYGTTAGTVLEGSKHATYEKLTNKVTTISGSSTTEYPSESAVVNYAEPKFTKNTGFNKSFGTSAGTVLEGNKHATYEKLTNKVTTISGSSTTEYPSESAVVNYAEPKFTKNTAFNKNFGTVAGTVLEGNKHATYEKLTNKVTTISGTSAVEYPSEGAVVNYAEPKITKKTAFNKNFGTIAGTVLEGDAAPGDIGAEPSFSKKSAFNKDFGTSAGTVLEGDASPGDIGAEPAFTKNAAFNKNFGTSAGTVLEGNKHATYEKLTNKVTTISGTSTTQYPSESAVVNYAEPKFTKNTAFNKNFGTTAGTVLEGDTSPGDIGAEPAFTKNTAFNKNFGTTAGTVLEGDTTPGNIGAEPAFSKNNAFNKNFGTSAGTVLEGNKHATYEKLTNKVTTISGTSATEYPSESAVVNYAEPKFTKNTAFNKNYGTTAGTVLQGNAQAVDSAKLGGVAASGYLPLSAGSGKTLTSDLYMGDNFIIGLNDVPSQGKMAVNRNYVLANLLGIAAKAADSSKLNGATESTTALANTIAKRDSSGRLETASPSSGNDAINKTYADANYSKNTPTLIGIGVVFAEFRGRIADIFIDGDTVNQVHFWVIDTIAEITYVYSGFNNITGTVYVTGPSGVIDALSVSSPQFVYSRIIIS